MKQWFIIRVSGQENKVAELIRKKLAYTGLGEEQIGEVIVPTKKISRLTKKGRIELDKKLYPGYIAIQIEPSEELFKLVSRTPGVLSFGNIGKNPQPISEEEKDRMFGYIKPEPGQVAEIPFTKGDSVKIVDGPFADFAGTVEEIYPDKERIKLMVTIFGRQTPVEIAFSQIEPI